MCNSLEYGLSEAERLSTSMLVENTSQIATLRKLKNVNSNDDLNSSSLENTSPCVHTNSGLIAIRTPRDHFTAVTNMEVLALHENTCPPGFTVQQSTNKSQSDCGM